MASTSAETSNNVNIMYTSISANKYRSNLLILASHFNGINFWSRICARVLVSFCNLRCYGFLGVLLVEKSLSCLLYFYRNGQTQALRGSASATEKITYDEALAYVQEVSNTFQENPEKYLMFLDVMNDLGEKRIDTLGAIARIKEVFKDHTNLLTGFYAFINSGGDHAYKGQDPSYNAPHSSATAEQVPSGHQAASASNAQRQPSKTPMKTAATGKQASTSKAPRRSPRKTSASQSKSTASQSKGTAVPKKAKKTASRNTN
ncbi:paired amphipathic helix protein Sin3-like 2 [Artemisia annua]|uniref:Paired amphipathic helix protein Sin3-like 2 n=1 Tax=Artemisia annua TaxID=35608 RepID=A0A2U1N0M8_ARTAN|nr:paired amphipathic helix protein Sin3-like 2 [Artemisia annua]